MIGVKSACQWLVRRGQATKGLLHSSGRVTSHTRPASERSPSSSTTFNCPSFHGVGMVLLHCELILYFFLFPVHGAQWRIEVFLNATLKGNAAIIKVIKVSEVN